MNFKDRLRAFLGFATYFLAGAALTATGAGLPQLASRLGVDVEAAALAGSAFAFGRLASLFAAGVLTERFGAKKILAAGFSLMAAFFAALAFSKNHLLVIAASALGGVGMGTQDAAGPLILGGTFRRSYEASMSAAQSCFDFGTFLPPLLVGAFLSAAVPFQLSYLAILPIPAALLLCLPFIGCSRSDAGRQPALVPLAVRNGRMGFIAAAAAAFALSAFWTPTMLFASTFGISLGLGEAASAQILTAFNVASATGALAFTPILKKIAAQKILFANSLFAFACVIVAAASKNAAVCLAAFVFAGFFTGPLFNLIVAIGTRISWRRASVASTAIAASGSAADMLFASASAAAVAKFGARAIFAFELAAIAALALASAAICRGCGSEK